MNAGSEEPGLEQEAKRAYHDWQKELFEEIADRAQPGGTAAIPDLDDMMFDPRFLEQDIALGLQFISTSMKAVRKNPRWKSKDLVVYKKWRQILLVERNKFKGLSGVTEDATRKAQEVLKQFYHELQNPLNENN